jgi:vancomycin resistance protein YoaR
MSKIQRVRIGPGESLSFNKVVGTYTIDAGYRKAPVSYNGTLLDGWGGGVCQTSTTVYNAALLSGMEIVKRGRHRFAPLYAPPGRDAAVAYPYIDLVIRNPFPYAVELRGTWTSSRLEAGFFAERRTGPKPQIETHIVDQQNPSDLVLASVGSTGRLRNSGKKAFEVITYRITGETRERISHDSYPAMHRFVEYK